MNKTIKKTMNKTIPAEMLPIVVMNPFLQLSARGTTALLHSAEFRLLSFAHNAQRHCAELSLYRNEQISKASLPEVLWSQIAPFEGQAIRIDYHQSASGHEPLQLIQYLAVVDKAQDPLATILPLWLECGQKDLYRELARLINLLEWPYRELVREVFRSDDLLQAFLDRPASLGHHHHDRGGLLQHSVEVALDCEHACKGDARLNASLTIAGALLHDIGKCEEYMPNGKDRYARSHRGELEMHKTLGVGIVKIAAHKCQADPLLVSEIVHVLVAAKGQHYMGLPDMKMVEAKVVQSADARSTALNLSETKNIYTTDWSRYGGKYRVPQIP